MVNGIGKEFVSGYIPLLRPKGRGMYPSQTIKRGRALVLPALALLCALAVSCARGEPRIVFAYIGLVYYQETDGPQERFTFFVIPEDDDGIENLADLFLYHDREQLRWHISSDEWVRYERDGRTWVGTRSIEMGRAGETLPRGQFRAVLVNLGGERTERAIVFDAPTTPRFPFPMLRIDDGVFTIDSAYPANRLVTYNAQGNFVAIVELDELTGTVASLGLPSNVSLVALWADDPWNFTSAFTDVIPIN